MSEPAGGYERLRRAIARHRRETECCRECSDALVADALAKRKATADGRLWASIERARPAPPTTTSSADSVLAPRDAVQGVIDWWRAANEAPGGVPSRDAIAGMREHVYALSDALERIDGSGGTDE